VTVARQVLSQSKQCGGAELTRYRSDKSEVPPGSLPGACVVRVRPGTRARYLVFDLAAWVEAVGHDDPQRTPP
jgi:hypothetical protein